MTKPGRIPCMVFGCRRTASAERFSVGVQIICGTCWRLAPIHYRRRIQHLERIGRKLGIDWDTTTWGSTKPGSPARRCQVLHAEAHQRLAKAAANVRVGIA